jgi:hypothetical protein
MFTTHLDLVLTFRRNGVMFLHHQYTIISLTGTALPFRYSVRLEGLTLRFVKEVRVRVFLVCSSGDEFITVVK